jgi:hypothetical protein
MPLVFALFASALLHVAAVVAPGWALPETLEADPPPAIDAVLAKAPAPTESAPVAKPVPKPVPKKPVPPPAVQPVVAAGAPSGVAPVDAPPPVEEPPPAAPPAPAIAEPAAPLPANIALPGKGRMRYIVTRGEGGFVIGESVHTWNHDGLAYRLESQTETTGIAAVFKPARIVQRSEGEISSAGLRPREFRHERAAGTDRASFDWSRGVVAYAGREAGLVEGSQDMLSMYYQLVLLAPRSGAIDMPIATGRKLANYRFEVLGEETLSFPAGERQAVRIRTRSGNDHIEMWLPVGADEQARGMPLKIRIIDRKGDIYDQIADDLSSTGTK